jgi:Cft2 family RNA processing exonuclease
MILSEPEEIPTMGGQKLPLKCSVDYISFSAHTDCNQTTDFIRELRPPHVVRKTIMKKKKMNCCFVFFSIRYLFMVKVQR